MPFDDQYLDLGQLKTFLTIVERRGFTRAARALGVSQPSVSQQMRRLEARLGHRLFASTKPPTQLTSDGQALTIFARSMFAITEKARRHFARPRTQGTVRVGLNEDLVRTSLPAVLNLFARSFPHFEIAIECDPNGQKLLRALTTNDLDIVVAKCLPGQERGEMLWREPTVWVTRRDHSIVPTDPLPLVLPPQDSEKHRIVLETLAQAGRTWSVRFRSPSLVSLEAAVQAGIGFYASGKSLRAPELAEVEVSANLPALPDLSFFIARRPDSDAGSEAFEQILKQAVLQDRAAAL